VITTVGQADFRRIKGAPLDWLTPSEIPIEIEHLITPQRCAAFQLGAALGRMDHDRGTAVV
jgi:hypothetical protein